MSTLEVKKSFEVHKIAIEKANKYGKPIDVVFDEMWEAQAKSLTEELVGMANTSNADTAFVKGIVQGILSQHRSIQDDFILALVTALRIYGESETDPRNELGVNAAKRMAEYAY